LARYQRFKNALRQVIANFGHSIADIGYRTIDGRTDLELQENVDLALDNEGRDIAHVADAGYRALHLLRDLSLHLGGRSARLGDADIDQGKSDIGT
jgi:hypothetical protein